MDNPTGQPYRTDELICVCVSRQINDGDVVAQGLATPMIAAGYLLARYTHAPNLYFASAIGQSLCKDGAPLGLQTAESLWLDRALVIYGFVQAAADLLPQVKPIEFFRPGQVDPHGNFNNIAFGSDYAKPRLRLPGTGGIPDVTTFLDRTYLYVPRHSRVTFVEKLDFLSGLGHHEGRLRGGGPCYLVTDLGQFDFKDGRMRLTHLHPGVELSRIKAKTGFQFSVAETVQVTDPPTAQELELLRNQIDPLAICRLELLSGVKRREVIREILEREKSNF